MEQSNLDVLAKYEHLQHPLIRQANKQFLGRSFVSAIELYKRYIEENIDQGIDIDGLGNNELSIGYYEWFIIDWYRDGILNGDYKGTSYDFLSLCYLSVKSHEDIMEAGIKWYRSMIGNYPNNYQLRLGYANILGNKAIYEEALDQYHKVTEMKPYWVRSYECIAYIYQYKRIQKHKSIEIANIILEIDPENRAGLFIIARNQKNSDLKIEKLKKVFELHPKYARAINEIGIVYGGTKKIYDDAIEWYKKCAEVAPQYASCYNNIGVNYELKKQYPNAIEWYFKGIEKDKQYKAPHKNLSDVFDTLAYTEEQIEDEMGKYSILKDYFCYYMGLSYYDKKVYEKSISYYMKAYDCAKELSKQIHKLHNSTGITYDQMKKNEQALNYYRKCIEANPKYHSAYYNIAIVEKRMNHLEEAIIWYKKAIEVNPRYSYAYNNLGNIYKNQTNYEEAIKCYRKAVQYLSTYTLAFANLGVCYLKLKNYREAFNAMSRAKEILSSDNNNLSESNKTFLKETLEQFDKEGEIWRQNGFVTTELKGHLQNYEERFKQFYTAQEREPVHAEKVMKKQILEIVEFVHEDQFELTNIDKIYNSVRKAFEDNEENFHIIPQLLTQYFYNHAFLYQRSILDIEASIKLIVQQISLKASENKKVLGDQVEQESRLEQSVIGDLKVVSSWNLFREGLVLNQYSQIYQELIRANEIAKDTYKQFKGVVDVVRKQSHGIPYGVQIKIPTSEAHQFQVVLAIFKNIFQKEINQNFTNNIIKEIFSHLDQRFKAKETLRLDYIENYAQKVWANQITQILRQRKTNNIPTTCEIGDLLKGKIIFECVEHLKRAITVTDQLCISKGFKILKIQNNLLEDFQDVVLNIRVKDAVCELKLAIKQDETCLHFAQSIAKISHSPLGCVFGSCLYLCTEPNYPFLRNCQDIVQHLAQDQNQSAKATLEASLYVIELLNQANLAPK